MIFGMTTANFTAVHVLLSLVGIASGLVAMWGLLRAKMVEGITVMFLVTTVLTSITGFGFPFDHLLPAHKVGIISLVVLAVAIPARYMFHLAGVWRSVYIVGSATALYLNVFVLVVQAFEKVPFLKALAPTQKEPPFLVVQLVVLLMFIAATAFAVKKFHVVGARTA
jgi:hypothetical protein